MVRSDLFWSYDCHSDMIPDEDIDNLSKLNERSDSFSILHCRFEKMDDMASVRFDQIQHYHHLNFEKQKWN